MPTEFDSELSDSLTLVTGGMGFIGSYLTARLLALGGRVVVVDCDTDPGRQSLLHELPQDQRSGLEIVHLDLRDRDAVAALIHGRNFDYVFHLAGYSVIEKSTAFPYDSLMTNAIGGLNVFDAVRRSDTPPRRVVITSTDKVYGEMDGSHYLEDSPLRGIGIYDAGKLTADVMARSHFHTFGTPMSVLRLCNVFGPHDYNVGYRLFPKSLSKIFNPVAPEPPVLYYESMDHWRDYVFVEDVIDALITMACHEQSLGEVFNMSSVVHLSTPSVIKEIIDTSVRILSEVDPYRAELVEKNGMQVTTYGQGALAIQRQRLDHTKIAQRLGFRTSVTFEQGLERTITHHTERLLRNGH
ncbi:NAD-dependent epimerase/dehydratase family protein [Nonomuraea soli]|uniref:NAD-dependent epimerase/dehydratase family protein n=1 Tax=Nonomuraea soli TaxID=1032476 RepID=UPI00248429D2|nr:NAD(P)-dependent oxidoreductase [Nonomuraea soli]